MAEKLLSDVEAFLRETGMADTAFGRAVNGDWRLVKTLRGQTGRSLTIPTLEKIYEFMERTRDEQKNAVRKDKP